jgi:quinol monooxygenase YgiN
MNKFGLYGKFIIEEGKRDMMVNILLEAAKSMEDLNECEVYHVHISEDEPNAVFVYEVWSNEAAHQASLTLESTQTLIKSAMPLITGMERISTLNPMGGKGLKS